MAESSTKDQNMEETAISPVNTDVVEVSKDDGEEKKLQSLLDFHLSDNQPSSSRIMLVSKLADSDEAVMEVILNDFKRLVKDFREEATGLGVVQDSVFVGVFECFPDDLCTLVRRVSDLSYLSDMKVLANSEDCPSRQFMPLSFHRLKLAKEGDIDLEGEFGDAATAGFSTYEKVLQVGKAMRSANSTTAIPPALQSNVPSNSRCIAYLAHEEFFSAEEFLESFDDPVHEVPIMDLIWPHQAPIPLS